jgi:uncharacterized protein YktA (UPF0223 family)
LNQGRKIHDSSFKAANKLQAIEKYLDCKKVRKSVIPEAFKLRYREVVESKESYKMLIFQLKLHVNYSLLRSS